MPTGMAGDANGAFSKDVFHRTGKAPCRSAPDGGTLAGQRLSEGVALTEFQKDLEISKLHYLKVYPGAFRERHG